MDSRLSCLSHICLQNPVWILHRSRLWEAFWLCGRSLASGYCQPHSWRICEKHQVEEGSGDLLEILRLLFPLLFWHLHFTWQALALQCSSWIHRVPSTSHWEYCQMVLHDTMWILHESVVGQSFWCEEKGLLGDVCTSRGHYWIDLL